MSVETDQYGSPGVDPYDEYFDSMTRGQRNKTMQPPPSQPVMINGRPVDISNAAVSQRKADLNKPHRGWFVTALRWTTGWTIIIMGFTFEAMGIVYTWIGKETQKWGRSMIV